jgi:hypothetical protein
MRTRMEKYRHYRAKIESLPESKFPPHEHAEIQTNEKDSAAISQAASSKGAIAYPNLPLKSKAATPYLEYSKKERALLLIKFATLAVVVAGFVCLYFFWVKGA